MEDVDENWTAKLDSPYSLRNLCGPHGLCFSVVCATACPIIEVMRETRSGQAGKTT